MVRRLKFATFMTWHQDILGHLVEYLPKQDLDVLVVCSCGSCMLWEGRR